MVGIYFSGTDNSKHCVEYFLEQYGTEEKAYAIEDEGIIEIIKEQDIIIFSYPVQYSNLPKIVYDFIVQHKEVWKHKRIFVIATMAFFSGDGAGVLARHLRKYGANIIGGLHIINPDSISDIRVLKRSFQRNKKLINYGNKKIEHAVRNIKKDKPPQQGLSILSHLAGLFIQRLYFTHKIKSYSDRLKIHKDKCIGCEKCKRLCPMKNIVMDHGIPVALDQCTMCYRCINHCPTKAITLLGKKVFYQSVYEKYQ